MYESACEIDNTCSTDQTSFKAYLSRWMADVAKLAPFTYDTIMSRLNPSAKAAAAHCTGGDTGTACGTRWTTENYDGKTGAGQQMSALEVVQVTLLDTVGGPLTNSTGGSSKSDDSAGIDPDSSEIPGGLRPIATKDRAGAWILTILMAGLIIGCAYVMLF